MELHIKKPSISSPFLQSSTANAMNIIKYLRANAIEQYNGFFRKMCINAPEFDVYVPFYS